MPKANLCMDTRDAIVFFRLQLLLISSHFLYAAYYLKPVSRLNSWLNEELVKGP